MGSANTPHPTRSARVALLRIDTWQTKIKHVARHVVTCNTLAVSRSWDTPNPFSSSLALGTAMMFYVIILRREVGLLLNTREDREGALPEQRKLRRPPRCCRLLSHARASLRVPREGDKNPRPPSQTLIAAPSTARIRFLIPSCVDRSLCVCVWVLLGVSNHRG